MDETQLSRDQITKIIEIKKDFWRYCRLNLFIKDKHSRIVPFVPNLAQTVLINYVLECIAKGKPIRAIILKARQMGLSTAVEALSFWWTSTNKNINTVILGHEEASSKNLYAMFRRYYDNCNPLFKPAVRYNTRTDLSFEKFDETGKQVGLGSSIKTATAGNKAAGRSDTINWLHGSEIGEWEDGEQLVASIMQTVPYESYMEKPSAIFLESTAKGRGSYFHKEWKAAENGSSNFVPFFFPWWIMDTYEIHDDELLGDLSEYEQFLYDLIKKGHTVAGAHIPVNEKNIPAKIKYYRIKSKDFASEPQLMFQEYPSTAEEAFLSSGKQVFNPLALKVLENGQMANENTEHYRIDIGQNEGEYVLEYMPYVYSPDRETENNGPLKVWKLPEDAAEYVIGADVAEGLATGDYSVAEVVDVSTMQTVARWRGHCDPDRFGEILSALGTMYNYALIGVEVNNHGLTTVQKLRDTFYTNLFKRNKGYDEDFEEPTSNLGWKTDVRTKRIMIDDLITIIRNHLNEEVDPVFIDEAFAYVRDDRGRMNAEEGEHDDTVMAKAVAFQLFPWGDNNTSSLRVTKPKQLLNRKNSHRIGKQ